MAKIEERKRTIVYSNVKENKKAERQSALDNNEVIDLDNEVFIGLAKLPKQEKNEKSKENKDNKKVKKSKNNSKDELQELWASEKAELEKEEKQKIKIEKKKLPKQKNNNEENTFNNDFNKGQVLKKQNSNSGKTSIAMQKKRVIKKLASISILLIIIIGGIIAFLLSPVLNIKTIEVKNNKIIPTDTIISMTGIKLNENLFKMSPKEAKKKLLQNPYIESAEIERKLFSKVEITVKERNATFMLEYGNSFVFINNQGYILEISTNKIETPIITGYTTPLDQIKPGNRLNKDDLEKLNTVLNIMEIASSNDLSPLITKIDIKNKKDYIITLEQESKIVYLGECLDLSTQMLYIKEMIQREKGIEGEFFIDMDLNTGNPVFREKV